MTSETEWINKPMDDINKYCDKIIIVMKTEDMSLLDLAICAARFKVIAKLFQDAVDNIKEEFKPKVKKGGQHGTDKKKL